MSNYSKNAIRVLYEIHDNDKEVIIFCGLCQKKLSSYRMIRYHFAVNHEVSKNQMSRISKVGRILEWGNSQKNE